MERHMELLEKQEEVLRFEHFDNAMAWELGTFMVKRAERLDLTIAVCIRLCTGAVVFQYLPDGTNHMNEKWMTRKFHTVTAWESSSLRAAFSLEEKGETLADHGLPAEEYALCGGGFPIRLEGSETVLGAVIASNLFHIADHEFVTGSLREFLNKPEAPEVPY